MVQRTGRPSAEQEGGQDRAPRRRLAPEARRAELLEAAAAVFTELGFARATLQDVADRAGVTKPAIYHYFASKDALFLELMRERVQERADASAAVLTSASPDATTEELLRALVDVMWRNLQQPGMIDLVRLIYAELPNFPELGRTFFEEIVTPARQPMRAAWRKSVDAPADRALAAQLTALLPAMMVGAALTQHVFGAHDPHRMAASRAGELVRDVLVRGAMAVLAEGAG